MSGRKEPVTLEAANAAFQGCAPGLRKYFSKRVPIADVEDLVQEVFLRMQVHGGERSIEHIDRYLFTVAASVLADESRRRLVRRDRFHESLEEFQAPAEELTPERVILDREARELMVTAIEDLPARTRDIFVMHRFEEMTCNSIALQLGMTASGVEKHIMKALRFLHERLGDG